MGDLQADTSLWLGTRVARVVEFARTDPGWRCHGSPYLDTDHRNCACTNCREARAGALGLGDRWTLSIYAESDVCRGISIMAGVDAVLWKPGCFSGMYGTTSSCEPRNCASGRTDFGSSIRSGLSYVQETDTPLVGTSQQQIGVGMARSVGCVQKAFGHQAIAPHRAKRRQELLRGGQKHRFRQSQAEGCWGRGSKA